MKKELKSMAGLPEVLKDRYGAQHQCLRSQRPGALQTVSDLADQAGRWKLALQGHGCTPGDVLVTMMVHNDMSFAAMEIAISSVGAVHFPVNFSDIKQKMEWLGTQVPIKAIVTNSTAIARWFTKEFTRTKTAVSVLLVRDGGMERLLDGTSKEKLSVAETLNCLLLTSGSGAAQKIVALTDENLACSITEFSAVDIIGASSCYLSILPLYFSGGRKVFYSSMLAGLEIALFDDGKNLLENIEDSKADLTAGTPHILSQLVKEAGGRRLPLRFICGGAVLEDSLLDAASASGINVYNVYGLTETASVLTYNTVANYKRGSVGRVSPLNQLAFDNAGRILVKGPNVFAGYIRDKKLISPVDGDGWFNTDDKGLMDEEGFVALKGRMDAVVKMSNGISIDLGEMEKQLAILLPDLKCKVILKDEFNTAAIVLPGSDGEAFDDEAVLRALRRYNEKHDQPIHLYYIDRRATFERSELKENNHTFAHKYGNVLFSQVTDGHGNN